MLSHYKIIYVNVFDLNDVLSINEKQLRSPGGLLNRRRDERMD